jgi:hypothetical protein
LQVGTGAGRRIPRARVARGGVPAFAQRRSPECLSPAPRLWYNLRVMPQLGADRAMTTQMEVFPDLEPRGCGSGAGPVPSTPIRAGRWRRWAPSPPAPSASGRLPAMRAPAATFHRVDGCSGMGARGWPAVACLAGDGGTQCKGSAKSRLEGMQKAMTFIEAMAKAAAAG